MEHKTIINGKTFEIWKNKKGFKMSNLTQNIVWRMKIEAIQQLEKDSPENMDEHSSAIESFCECVLPEVLETYGADDECAINEAFNNYTDMLCKDGVITEETYNNITFDFENWDS